MGRPINSSHSSFEDAKHRFSNNFNFNKNDEQTERSKSVKSRWVGRCRPGYQIVRRALVVLPRPGSESLVDRVPPAMGIAVMCTLEGREHPIACRLHTPLAWAGRRGRDVRRECILYSTAASARIAVSASPCIQAKEKSLLRLPSPSYLTARDGHENAFATKSGRLALIIK